MKLMNNDLIDRKNKILKPKNITFEVSSGGRGRGMGTYNKI